MQRIDDILRKRYRKIPEAFKKAFAAAIAAGLIAHIYMFTNKLPNFDDLVGLNGFGATFKNGRWFLWVLGATAYHLDLVFSLPWMNGLFTLLMLGTAAGLIAVMLGMKSTLANVLAGAALVVFPSWTSTFFYMFTTPYYAIAVLMAVVSVFWTVRGKSLIRYAGGVVMLACSIGIYQAYLPFTATLYVILLFLMLYDDRCGFRVVLKRALYYLSSLALSVIMYYICMKVSLAAAGQSLTAYKGISSMGSFSLSRIPEIIRLIGHNFFGVFINNNLEISYNLITKGMYFVLFAICAVLIAGLVVYLLKKGQWQKGLAVIVMTIVYIIAINSIYIICSEGIYSLMYYSYVFLMIFPLALIDRSFHVIGERTVVLAEYIAALAITAGIASYCHFANGQYVSMNLSLNQAMSYYSTLITQIKSTDGYRDDMKVAFHGQDITDKTLYHNEIMKTFSMSGRDDALADAYSRWMFIQYYCGFNPQIAYTHDLPDEVQAEIDKMPCYPLEGSIRIFDDTVVVRFAQTAENM